MTAWGAPIRSFLDLLRATAAGGRIVFTPKHELAEVNQWHPYRLIAPDGTERPIEPKVAIAAYRKGLIQVTHR